MFPRNCWNGWKCIIWNCRKALSVLSSFSFTPAIELSCVCEQFKLIIKTILIGCVFGCGWNQCFNESTTRLIHGFFGCLDAFVDLSPLFAIAKIDLIYLKCSCFFFSLHFAVTRGNPDSKRLYDDLLSNYNKLVRPVINVSDALTVRIKLKLSQLIDVNLKNQIMTTNLWVEQSWYDYKLKWEPKEYGGVEMLHVPSDHIWRPDIVLYNK